MAHAHELPKGIRWRGGKYYVDVSVSGTRKTRTCPTLEQALLTREELRSQLRSGKNPSSPTGSDTWTLQKAYDVTRTTRWKGAKAERSANLNAQRALEFFGKDTLLDDISVSWLDEYVTWLQARGNSNGGVNRKLAALSVMFTTALDREGCSKKPRMPRQKEGMGRIRWLTDVEERKALALLHQWGDDDMHDVFITLVDTGMRLGELWSLEERDLNGKVLTIWKNKTDLPRSVPMTTRVKEILDRRVEQSSDGRLFPYSGEWIRTRWTRLRTNMGMSDDPQFVPHMLRHTFASRLVQKGATIPVVQQLMGHKTISMTMRYAHLAPANLSDAINLLEN